jgi:hypothetical protein
VHDVSALSAGLITKCKLVFLFLPCITLPVVWYFHPLNEVERHPVTRRARACLPGGAGEPRRRKSLKWYLCHILMIQRTDVSELGCRIQLLAASVFPKIHEPVEIEPLLLAVSVEYSSIPPSDRYGRLLRKTSDLPTREVGDEERVYSILLAFAGGLGCCT